MKVHLVIGEQGCYSDWTTWVAAGYFKGDDAESHIKRLQEITALWFSEENQDKQWDDSPGAYSEWYEAEAAYKREIGLPKDDDLYGSSNPPKFKRQELNVK